MEAEPLPKIKPEPPRFNGENVVDWIRKIQRYYNHHFTPLHDRLYLTAYLFDHPASSWLTYWEDNCHDKGCDDFLLALKHRFDPDLYVDYVGALVTLRQTTTVEAYQSAFEDIMQKVSNVGDETLMSLFIADLQEPIKQNLLTQRPASLNEVFALAHQLAACQTVTVPKPTTDSKHSWADGDSRPRQNGPPPLTTSTPNRQGLAPQPRPGNINQPRLNIPIVRITAAERAERTRRGQCWWCPEKYTLEHVCSRKFYALMGTDDEDDETGSAEEQATEEDGENMVITGDVSRIYVISPKLQPQSIRLTGSINGATVSVLIDGGSTHNFIKPTVAE